MGHPFATRWGSLDIDAALLIWFAWMALAIVGVCIQFHLAQGELRLRPTTSSGGFVLSADRLLAACSFGKIVERISGISLHAALSPSHVLTLLPALAHSHSRVLRARSWTPCTDGGRVPPVLRAHAFWAFAVEMARVPSCAWLAQ